MMSEIAKELKYFWSKKIFAVGLPLVMFLAYCTLITNPTIGIDDTSFKLYYIDGVSPAMGRWVIYMINKIIPLNYNPVFVECVGLIFFCISVSLWTIVFYRIFGESIPTIGYTIFACTMISSPILSEVVIWYCQDCIYLGYGFTALAVLIAMQTFRKNVLKSWKRRIGTSVFAGLILAVGLGCYESFMIVFLMACILIFLSIRLTGNTEYGKKPIDWVINIGILGVAAMIFRSIIIDSIIAIYKLEDQKLVLASRDAGDILGGIGEWFDGTRTAADFVYVLKDFFVKYYLNAIVYVPVMILALAMIVLIAGGIWGAVKKKDIWIVLSIAGIVLIPLILPIVEGTATYYRSSQYVPLLTAYAVLLIIWRFRGFRGASARAIGIILAFILLYRQGYEMNRWLYADAMKYENDKLVMGTVALQIMEKCENPSKPVCVIGSYETPVGLIENVYVPDWSKKYTLIKFFVEALDPEIFEKYNTEYGYSTAESPQLSFINWGSVAYYGFDRELIKFWKMHGFSFTEDGELDHYEDARELMKDGPVWPAEGSIVELDDYIIVNFGNY